MRYAELRYVMRPASNPCMHGAVMQNQLDLAMPAVWRIVWKAVTMARLIQAR